MLVQNSVDPRADLRVRRTVSAFEQLQVCERAVGEVGELLLCEPNGQASLTQVAAARIGVGLHDRRLSDLYLNDAKR